MSRISFLSAILERDYRGPRASFTEAHVLKAILEIGESKSLGRGKLGTILGLGQGEVKTLIRRLKERGLISIKSSGCTLTKDGVKQFRAIKRVLPWSGKVEASSLGMGKYSWSVVLRGRSARVKRGIEQRDEAIKVGAKGALTLVFLEDRFKIPDDGTDCEKANPNGPWAFLREKANPKEKDVIIISGGDTPKLAEYGAISAALTIL
jgi:predicted transcriptional regulator